jgi:hypothetical protein
MPSCLVITDTPDLSLAEGKFHTSEVQIAKTGRFSDPRYGVFTITASDFARWIKNFNELHRSEGREGLPIDVDHGPETTGNTEAAGWCTALTVKNGTELWATVEWNELGISLVQSKRYRYLSPSYVHNYKDETGKQHGTALIGVGLTNRPFLRMATVSLSADMRVAEELADDPSYTPESMPDFTKIAEALKLSGDADEATILAAITEQSAAPTTPVSLAEQAKAQGLTVLTADQYASLAAQATAGAAADVALAELTFNTAFDAKVEAGMAVPAQKDVLLSVYEKDRDLGMKMLDALNVPIVNVAPAGSGAGGEDGAELSAELHKDAEGYTLSTERGKLHERAVKLAAERNIDYGDAVMVAAEEMGVA